VGDAATVAVVDLAWADLLTTIYEQRVAVVEACFAVVTLAPSPCHRDALAAEDSTQVALQLVIPLREHPAILLGPLIVHVAEPSPVINTVTAVDRACLRGRHPCGVTMGVLPLVVLTAQAA
jgi:hypothetical protein